ncbi:hypothetical protein PHMEG_00017784 [Phytophthora megakarya]|uniref:Reverse transcriptase RNase H-like domain-containing protein n=1 Tax=Phytophthora megakarya TaxID=4795 RepID=A0A225VVN9_9STRA|nr:hypothetical protein PHMEG_00017784 [Phytophthora megakarya]
MAMIDDILDVLGKPKLFSTMDIASGYWNVRIYGSCQYREDRFHEQIWSLRMAVLAFERLMENVLVDLNDDFPPHLVRVRQVLERFRALGFKLKMKKCHWGRNQVAFLGHIVTPSGILPNPEKVKAVMNVARPHHLHTVRAFLGLTSYVRRYIHGFATIAAPLERLKEQRTDFRWNEDCEVALNQLQRSLVRPPILVYPDFSKRFKLYVDSSHSAVGVCLMQEVDCRDRAVAFASKMLVGSQKHWIDKNNGTTEIECWGVVWATRKFRCYLDHSEFDLFADHQALTWIFSENTRTTNVKLARWAMELSQLRFKIHHRAGTLMGHADGLSRLNHLPMTGSTLSAVRRRNISAIPSAPTISGTWKGTATLTTPGITSLNASSDVVVEVGETTFLGGSSRFEDDEANACRAEDCEVDGVGEMIPEESLSEQDQPRVVTQEEQEEDEEGLEEVDWRSNEDTFGLDSEKFVEVQLRTPWMIAIKVFLEGGALAMASQFRVLILRMAPQFEMRNGVLMRRVHLRARAGHANTKLVPVIPLRFIETVLYYCHGDLMSAPLGKTKTLQNVRHHAYWPGWKNDAAQYVRCCHICHGGKGSRPWQAGRMQ